jgi:3-hydroxybutyryl-CoA dehydrogenase
MNVEKLGVVGAGQMGAGIAQVAAQSGLQVILVDVNAQALELGHERIAASLARLTKKGALTDAAAHDAKARIRFENNLAKLSDCDFVIEAVPENEQLKKQLFGELGSILKPSAIAATNTSSISITRLATAFGRPEQFIGMHFMNPVPVMKLVEIIRGSGTSDQTHAATAALAERLGKTTTTSKDFPGFISNRLLMPLINEAFFALWEGIGTATDIDQTLRLGMNHPMGPLELADVIGLDTCLSIMQVLHNGFDDSKYRPCPLLRQYVDAGHLGKKSGRGVYIYERML